MITLAWIGILSAMLGMCYTRGRKRGRDEMFCYLRKVGAVKAEVIRNLPSD